MIRYAAQVLLCLLIATLLAAEANGQKMVSETASNFVNFNLNGINRVRSYYPEYNGQGMTVSIKEFQYDTLDIDFAGRHLSSPRAAGQTSPHSTLMATIIGGGGNSFLTGRGTAWGARLTSSSFLDIFPDPNAYFRSFDIGVQNHSYGLDSIENLYGPTAAAYDLQASQLPELLHVFSIGNRGLETPLNGPYAGIRGYANMTGAFKLAKNVLTMGVVDSFGIIDPLSSRGPAFDGRIKPELVAFGIDGSSAAAALASGAALILQQAYREMYGTLPAAALVKALLINSAVDLGPEGIDHVYGYGGLNVFRSLENLLNGHYLSDTLSFDTNHRHLIRIPEGVAQFKITLTWTDPPATVNTEKALINDLDLELMHVADNQGWLPQLLSSFPHPDSLARPAGSGEDHLNTIEQIVLQQPPAGEYEINIKAFDLQVAEQAYHLAYSWDTLSSFEWLFPSRDNQLVPSDNFLEQIYWRASEVITAEGELSYSYDGIQWEQIASGIDLSAGTYAWAPPDTVARLLLRMQADGQSFLSDTFTVASQPSLRFVLNCPDSIGLSWTKQAGIEQYQLYRLEDQYLEPFRVTSDTFLILQKEDFRRPYIALAPLLPGGQAGVRSLAYNFAQQPEYCYFQNLSGEVVGETTQLRLQLSTAYNLADLSLEKSVAGQFMALQTISTPAGLQFELTDPDPDPGLNTYQVKIRLINGAELYSNQLSLNFIEPDQFKIYPNPLSRLGEFRVLYNVPEPEQVRFEVYTALGKRVFSMNLLQLDNNLFAEDFQSGLYFYRFVRDSVLLQSGKLVVR